jgi:hypothetical protein
LAFFIQGLAQLFNLPVEIAQSKEQFLEMMLIETSITEKIHKKNGNPYCFCNS